MNYLNFKAHLRVEALSEEGVFLLSERGQTVLRGRLYELLVPLIDGQRSADDIADRLDGQLSTAEVYYALAHMEKKGYITATNGAPSLKDPAFWHIQNMDPTEVSCGLSKTTVSPTIIGGVDFEPLAVALKAVAVRTSGTGQFGIVVTDDYLRCGLESYNQRALDESRSWMLVKPVGSLIWIGPVFVPGRTACWECLADRLRGNRETETYVQQQTGRSDPLAVPLVDTPATRCIACNLAATEIAKWLACGHSELEGKLLTLDILSWKTEWHTVVRRPQCSACGAPGATLSPEIRIQRRKKTFTRDGGHRSVSPKETLRRYQHHVSRLTGAVPVLERSLFAGDGIVNVYGSGHNFARRQGSVEEIRTGLRSQSCGKGTTDAQSKASALCEALERYSGVFRGDEPRTPPRRLRDLGEAAIHPNVCMQYSQKQFCERDAWNARESEWNSVPEPFDESKAVEWTPVWSLTRKERRYLPTAFCYYDYPMQQPYCFACSNGNAAGNTLEEAILQGFFELVERDSVALWWYNRVRRSAVNLDSFDEPYLRQLATFLRDQQRRDLWVLDLTSDLEIPVFAALSRRTDQQPEEILMGFGSHFDARVALLRAVTELNQMLSWVFIDSDGKAQAHETLDDPETLQWLKTATLENQPYLVSVDAPRRDRSDFSECSTDDVRDDVLACQALIERQGLEMLILDQTRSDIGLPVVKVIVPGLRHFWARYAPGRLYNVPVKLGWLPQPHLEEELNPIPMFL